MKVVEFRKKRRGSVERKGTRMYGAAEGRPGIAGGRFGRIPEDGEMAVRAEALARRVREHREAFARSQQEFAEESGISRATLSKIEQGSVYPSMKVRRKLAKALGVGPQELWNVRSESHVGPAGNHGKQAS